MMWMETARLMPHPFINDPKYWQERAEEALSIARLLNDREGKRHLLAIAARYERLADHMKSRKFKAERARRRRSSKKPTIRF
jgi:hypothetical protein